MPHDVAKASLGGADFVMLGGMLGRHDRGGGGNIITKHYANGEYTQQDDGSYVPHFEQKHFVQFYGMSLDASIQKNTLVDLKITEQVKGVKSPFL